MIIRTVTENEEEMHSIHLENLINPIHREFVNDTIIEARKYETITTTLARQLAALEAAFTQEMQASVIVDTIQNMTAEIDKLANERSKAQTALKSGFRAVMGMADADKVTAATTLFELMHKYDLHTGMSVDQQTAIIDSFFLDVDENHAAQLQTTGMTELYDLLKVCNQRVCDKVIERDEANRSFGTGRMENARAATDAAWRELRTAVNAHAYTDGYEGYAGFIAYMNVLIIRYKRVHLNQTAQSPEATPGTPSPAPENPEQTPGETPNPENPNPGTGPENSEGSEGSEEDDPTKPNLPTGPGGDSGFD